MSFKNISSPVKKRESLFFILQAMQLQFQRKDVRFGEVFFIAWVNKMS